MMDMTQVDTEVGGGVWTPFWENGLNLGVLDQNLGISVFSLSKGGWESSFCDPPTRSQKHPKNRGRSSSQRGGPDICFGKSKGVQTPWTPLTLSPPPPPSLYPPLLILHY